MTRLLIAAAIAMMVSLFGTVALMRFLVRHSIGQPIRDDGPEGHHTKAGTPTMGGLAIVAGATAGYVVSDIFGGIYTRSGIFVMGAIIGGGAVGLMDDSIKVVAARNLGLNKKAKLLGLLIVGISFAVLMTEFTSVHTTISFTRFDNPGIELGRIGWTVWAVLLILATTNAVNLTDGLDGLAAGAGGLGYAAFTFIGFWQFDHFESYEVAHALDLAVVGSAMVGGIVGFLWWNAAPAQIFMGDTGSLAIGSGLAALALSTNTPASAARCWWPVRRRNGIGDHPGRGLPALPKARLSNGSHPPPSRARRVARNHSHRAALDPVRAVHGVRAGPVLRRRRQQRHRRFDLAGHTMTTDIADLVVAGPTAAVVVGFGVANRAVARALQSRGHYVTAVDDQQTDSGCRGGYGSRYGSSGERRSRRFRGCRRGGRFHDSHTGATRVAPGVSDCPRHHDTRRQRVRSRPGVGQPDLLRPSPAPTARPRS